jgi:glycosyltransferase involved in cell wall biosynthesis
MPAESLTLTIVIPVYNEEDYLGACLDSIENQIVPPDEVIVVDNNSTDKTVEIARKFKFVTILQEPRQHQVFAQATGFNGAKSDILGRIDADSILPPDWVRRIKSEFESGDVVAVTGGADPYDAPMSFLARAIFNWYTFMVRLIIGHRILWGANCALRKSAWEKIKDRVMMRSDIWEDYDMAFCLDKFGRIKYLRGLRVGFSLRSMHTSFRKHVSYQFRSVRTMYYRANPLQLVLFLMLWTTTFIVYPLSALDDWLLKRE